MTCPRDDLILSVRLDVARGNGNASVEIGIVSVEAAAQRDTRGAKLFDMRSTSRAGTGDDVRVPVTVEILGGHESAAVEVGIKRHEFRHERPGLAIEHADVR